MFHPQRLFAFVRGRPCHGNRHRGLYTQLSRVCPDVQTGSNPFNPDSMLLANCRFRSWGCWDHVHSRSPYFCGARRVLTYTGLALVLVAAGVVWHFSLRHQVWTNPTDGLRYITVPAGEFGTIHLNVTEHPTGEWVVQQTSRSISGKHREAIPDLRSRREVQRRGASISSRYFCPSHQLPQRLAERSCGKVGPKLSERDYLRYL